MHVHAIETGRLRANRTFLRAENWRTGLLGRRSEIEFPVLSFAVEHPEGLLVIDTGLDGQIRVPRWQRRFAPVPAGPPDPMAAQLAARGLDPGSVRRVVLTHLDWDHVGGVGAYPDAEVLVHRPEHEAATSRAGAQRYQPGRWPRAFAPVLYDLDETPLGPFPRSRAVTQGGDVVVVALAGHSAGHVGVVVRAGATTLLFCGDHVLREDWWREDRAAGRELGLGIWYPRRARATSRRLAEFLDSSSPVVLLPSHDSETPARLAAALAG